MGVERILWVSVPMVFSRTDLGSRGEFCGRHSFLARLGATGGTVCSSSHGILSTRHSALVDVVDCGAGTHCICGSNECDKLYGRHQRHYSRVCTVGVGAFGFGECKGRICSTEFVVVAMLSACVFCLFNFRPKGKAKCFAGDVGSIGMAFIMLFLLGRVILATEDITWLIFLLVYGVDGCLTIVHRIMLHENLGEAHRKHAYQIMANELKIGHVKVALLYVGLQLVISLGFIYICPDTVLAHWAYLLGALAVLAIAYVAFMKKYYHLHEAYLASLKK